MFFFKGYYVLSVSAWSVFTTERKKILRIYFHYYHNAVRNKYFGISIYLTKYELSFAVVTDT